MQVRKQSFLRNTLACSSNGLKDLFSDTSFSVPTCTLIEGDNWMRGCVFIFFLVGPLDRSSASFLLAAVESGAGMTKGKV